MTDQPQDSRVGLTDLIHNLQQEDNRDLVTCLTDDLNAEIHSMALLTKSVVATPTTTIRLLRRFGITLESLPSPTKPKDFAPKDQRGSGSDDGRRLRELAAELTPKD